MGVQALYRACIWLPLVVPAIAMVVVTALGRRVSEGVLAEVFAYSLVWGGIPYAALAAWATWWVGGRSEREIRRLMFVAPLLMLAVFVPLALIVGLIVGALEPFLGVAMLGGVLILLLGYGYVGLTVLVRLILGSRLELPSREQE